jgi:hypothetical protein
MAATITAETTLDEITPELVMSTTHARELRTVVIDIPNSDEPYISLERARLRTGTLELFFDDDETAAERAEEIIAAGGTYTLTYPERLSWEMRFTPTGTLERRLDDETRDHWVVSFGFQELIS